MRVSTRRGGLHVTALPGGVGHDPRLSGVLIMSLRQGDQHQYYCRVRLKRTIELYVERFYGTGVVS